jgi:DNA-binding Lrp family transcriptional regulator
MGSFVFESDRRDPLSAIDAGETTGKQHRATPRRTVFIMIDALDGKILHSLQLAPRVPFRRIAEVVDAPEQAVARRYRKLHRDGVVRVIGLLNPRVHGDSQWVVRVRAKPDDLPRLAEALVRRPEVTHANVLSGWTELVCIIRAPLGDTKDSILQRLPRTSTVLALEVDLILRVYGEPATAQWTAYGHTLDAVQAEAIQQDNSAEDQPADPATPGEQDQALLDALAADGRVPHARLGHNIGWSPARVKRRIAALEASGTLTFDVDLLPALLGFDINAMVWLTTRPRDLAAVAEEIAAHEEVASVVAVSGRNNLMAVVICRDVEHLYRYVAERLAGIDQIVSYDMSIRAQRLKQAGSIVSHGRLVPTGP